MVSHCTYAIAVLPLHMSFTVKIKLTTGLCNMRLEGQEYIQGAKKNNRGSHCKGDDKVGNVGRGHVVENTDARLRVSDFSL